MNKLIKLYNNYFGNSIFFKLYFYLIIIVLLILFISFIVNKIRYRIKRKNIYVGCLYSKTGVVGSASYDNYKILLESFKYAVKKYNCNIKIIPLYKDLGDNLDNFTEWVEECVKKYNIKYFFGCWRSSERIKIKPILEKYNLKLFYPLQYEGIEFSNNIYYFGACPNQQLIPGLIYMFDTFYYYNDVYVIGSDYIYPQISLLLVEKFIKNNNKRLVYSKLYPLDQKDFSDFITILFKKSPNGAIIINLINGTSYINFSKQFYEYYYKIFPKIDKSILISQNKTIKYLTNPKLEKNINIYERYPSLSTSIVENDISKKNEQYLKGNLYAWNFSSEILINPIYYLTLGYEDADKDLIFLKKFMKNQNKPIGDTQYCSFLSVLFFVKTCKDILDNKENIYDPNIYDKYKNISINSISGFHSLIQNNHITKTIFILESDDKGSLYIRYQGIYSIMPAPFMYLTDNILTAESTNQNINIAHRIYQ
jgi:urea transport system substrate-binding protein